MINTEWQFSKRAKPAVEVALVGIDGIGKSTLARHLVQALEPLGSVEIVSWERAMRYEPIPFVVSGLKDLGLSFYRALYGEVMTGDLDIKGTFPTTWEEFEQTAYAQRLDQLRISSNDLSGIIASSLVELLGALFLSSHVVKPRLAAGISVVHESYGLKNAVRGLVMGRCLARRRHQDEHAMDVINDLLRVVEMCLLQWAAPDVGVLLAGEADLALRWRMHHLCHVRIGEDLRTIGDSEQATFVEFQRECAAEYERIAQERGWVVVEMVDRPEEENVDVGVQSVLARVREMRYLQGGFPQC